MELARADALAKKGINWGKLTFEHLRRKEEELRSGNVLYLSARKRVQEALESNLVISGTLDGSTVLSDLSIDDQCSFFMNYPKCENLILQGWIVPIADVTLRCVSITMGENLIELDMSNSMVNTATLEIMLSHVQKLKIIKFNNCPNIDSICMGLLAKYAGHTIKELYVSNCKQFKLDPLLALSGSIGFCAGGLKKINVLDLSENPAVDRGLIGISLGCTKLKYLNLQNCIDITDIGVISIVQTNEHLIMLNLSGCILLTNKSAKNIGNFCPNLKSINLSKCSKITNSGVKFIAMNCYQLQNVNLSGLIKLSEESLCVLITNCLGLLMLNVSGCELVTNNGLNAIISGLKYVEAGITFVGFKPIDKHIELKLQHQKHYLETNAIEIITNGFEKRRKFKEQKIIDKMKRLEKAARLIQEVFYRYRCRQYFYDIWYKKKRIWNAINIQRVWRGSVGRKRGREIVAFNKEFQSKRKYAVLIQKVSTTQRLFVMMS